jgi:CBS domain-containing protein
MLEFFSHARDAARGAAPKKLSVRSVMTTPVVTVEPDAPVQEIARLLDEHKISAMPVVDSVGAVVGVVSEGDLIGRAEEDRRARRSWWLAMIAQGKTVDEEMLERLAPERRTAREVMTTPVITVGPDTDIGEVAQLLLSHRIKRAPVVEEGHIVGVISRADMVRALLLDPGSLPAAQSGGAEEKPTSKLPEPHHRHQTPLPAQSSADDLRKLVHHFDHLAHQRREAESKAAVALRTAALKEFTEHHLQENTWQATLQRAQDAAACGAQELLLLRFPHDLCSDGGRAINAPDPDWPQTLRGEAAEVYLRWKNELQPRGFQLAARIMDFPGGFIGDVGLFLVWGK